MAVGSGWGKNPDHIGKQGSMRFHQVQTSINLVWVRDQHHLAPLDIRPQPEMPDVGGKRQLLDSKQGETNRQEGLKQQPADYFRTSQIHQTEQKETRQKVRLHQPRQYAVP